jgi:hypothetical protein
MMEKARVKNENMVRDMKTTALLSTDHDAIRAYEMKKRERNLLYERLNSLERQVAELKAIVLELRNGRIP